MKILIHVFSWPPNNFSGADMMLYRLMQKMPQHEFQLHIEPYMKPTSGLTAAPKYEWCDCVWTHLILTSPITNFARKYNKPVFHFVHNCNMSTIEQAPSDNYLIYNSEFVRNNTRFKLDGIVINPPVYKDEFAQREGQAITIINCTPNKGYGEFLKCANNLPNLKFNAVLGGYGSQLQQQSRHKNIHFLPHSPTLKEVFINTGVLLVPSRNESWSLVAAEAQACGIPIIASDLPGIRENLGDSSLYGNFLHNLIHLSNDVNLYEKYVNLGLMNTEKKQVKQEKQLKELDNFMHEKVVHSTKKEKQTIKQNADKRNNINQ